MLALNIQNVGVAGSPTVSFATTDPSYKIVPGSSCVTTGVTAGQTCSVQVEFDPVNPGNHPAVLTVTSSNGNVTTANLTGFATAP